MSASVLAACALLAGMTRLAAIEANGLAFRSLAAAGDSASAAARDVCGGSKGCCSSKGVRCGRTRVELGTHLAHDVIMMRESSLVFGTPSVLPEVGVGIS